jgi:regulator of replication initiation timing
MDKWDLLHIGAAYVGVHTFKWKDYVTVRDFSTTTNALSKEILELEEENKKLKEEISSLRIELEQEKWKTGKKWTPVTPYI